MTDRTVSSLVDQRVIVTGSGGQLGGYLVQALARAGATPIAFGHHPGQGVEFSVDIADAPAVERAVADARADAVIHAAAMTDVDGCELDPARADRINRLGAKNVGRAAVECGNHLVAVSTDFVFSGETGSYEEDCAAEPVSVYGASKHAGELEVLAADSSFAVARTAWVYGGHGKHFPRSILSLLERRQELDVVTDERGNPTFAGDLAEALVQLLAVRQSGIVHLVNEGQATRFELARRVAALAGLDPERIRPTTAREFLRQYPLPARRPADSTLLNRRAAASGISLRPWSDALASYVPRLVEEMSARHE